MVLLLVALLVGTLVVTWVVVALLVGTVGKVRDNLSTVTELPPTTRPSQSTESPESTTRSSQSCESYALDHLS